MNANNNRKSQQGIPIKRINNINELYHDLHLPMINDNYHSDKEKSSIKNKTNRSKNYRKNPSFEYKPKQDSETSEGDCSEDDNVEKYRKHSTHKTKFYNESIMPIASMPVSHSNLPPVQRIITFDNLSTILREDYTSKEHINLETLKRNRAIYDEVNLLYEHRRRSLSQQSEERKKQMQEKVNKLNEMKVSYKSVLPRDKRKNYLTTLLKEMKPESRNKLLSDIVLQGISIPVICHRPVSRMGCTLTAYDDVLFLIAGLASERLFDIWMLKEDKDRHVWEKIHFKGEAPLIRLAHTTVVYKNELFIYGGNVSNLLIPKEDINVYNIDTHMLLHPKCENRRDVKWRRNHVAVVVGHQMFINGGIDEHDQYLYDSHLLDLKKHVWYKLKNKDKSPVAFHAATLVITSDRKLNEFSFFKFYNEIVATKSKVIVINIR
jgi:hypothetical protein